MLNKTADLRNKLVLLALWVNQKRKHTNSRSSSSSSSSSDPSGWDSCDGCWWWMIVGQRACFLDVPLTSMSHTQISSEDERYTHTFTYMTRIHTEPTTHTHTLYLTFCLDGKTLHSLHWPTSALHKRYETKYLKVKCQFIRTYFFILFKCLTPLCTHLQYLKACNRTVSI